MEERVMLLSNHSVLIAGVLSILEEIDGLEIAVVPVDDPDAMYKIAQFVPSVIVLDAEDGASEQQTVTRLLAQNPKARIVSLRLQRTDIDVYRLERSVQPSLEHVFDALQRGN